MALFQILGLVASDFSGLIASDLVFFGSVLVLVFGFFYFAFPWTYFDFSYNWLFFIPCMAFNLNISVFTKYIFQITLFYFCNLNLSFLTKAGNFWLIPLWL